MSVVVIGAGPAGITVAERVRERRADVSVTVLSAEVDPPYSPPALADYFLSGREDALFWKGRDVCERLAIDFRPGARVRAVKPAAHEVVLASGEVVPYDKLVVASGSRLYAPVAGHDQPGVYNFKSLAAARALVAAARRERGASAVVVGAGFIGTEIALLLADLGVRVTLVEALDRVMPTLLDPDTAEVVRRHVRARGVEVRLGTTVRGFRGAPVSSVELGDGRSIVGDFFVAATGVQPNLELLHGSGIEVEQGVFVDRSLATSAPDVFACGDVAQTWDRRTGELGIFAVLPNAVAQAEVVAQNLLEGGATYEGSVRQNSLKHLGIPVIAVGAADGDEEARYDRGEVVRRVFLRDDRIVGYRLCGDISGAGVYYALMMREVKVSASLRALASPHFGFGSALAAVVP